TPQIKVLPMVTTDYIVSTKNKKCPNISDTIRVTVYPKPKAGFTLSKVQGLFPLDVHFTNNSKNANKYIWMFGDSISSSNTIDANFIYKQSGLYHPTLIASNPFCSDTATSSIDVYEPYSIYIPDIFTPNSDGLNDLFEPQITSMKSIEGKIFTRWGEEIYSFSIPTNKWWNGTFHDKKVEDGIYIYNLDVIDKRGKSHYYYGRIYVAQ
ncbi:MAG: gliding motility-associated C-terminal domain-containing protein, partial [Bacteroidetes bacterium]|nr:gliding motility-associated C-terminal domain-containing protein [Bacteroidota bacterium]